MDASSGISTGRTRCELAASEAWFWFDRMPQTEVRKFVGRGSVWFQLRIVSGDGGTFRRHMPEGDMLPGFAGVSILVKSKADMHAQAIGHLGNLGCLLLGTENEL